MALVPFDRILVYLAVQPFYNQIWGVFALPLILLFGLRFLREPSRGAAALRCSSWRSEPSRTR